MATKIFDSPAIYRLDIPLPDNPLKNLNCYVVQDAGETLIIDTGFNQKPCYDALMAGFEELQLDWANTTLFLTHLHSDHVGLAGAIHPKEILMGEVDYRYFIDTIQGTSWDELDEKFAKEGFPVDAIQALHDTNPAIAFAPNETFSARTLNDGDTFSIGRYTFQCVFTPGHTPGHMCLYLPEKELMFLGDHVLFDITPNITFWNGMENSLGQYLQSLQKIRRFAVKTALPAHRKNEMDFYERVDAILHHHQVRLDECLRIVTETPSLDAYHISAQMQWSMRGKDWDHFPMHQKWFAVGETIAHLDYLIAKGQIARQEKSGIYRYVPTASTKN